MIASNAQRNDCLSEKVICMIGWLDECMRIGSKGLSNSIHTAAFKFITYNHTVMHAYLTTAETGIINK